MSSLGSASIQLKLDRSRFDSDLQKLSQQDAGSIAVRAKLDTKDFDRQFKEVRSQLQQLKPIFIPVELDTTKFNEQIKKLSANIDPIKIDLAPNVKDFQEKLKRIGRISPIEVEVKVDKVGVKSQFAEIGRYASEGFAQGFSGAEDAGKSAVDSMVRSVKSQLGIQSPSRVFREIGRYAAEGLSEGLREIDDGEINQRVDRIINQFERISNYKFGNIGNGITGLITKPLKAIESVVLAPFKGVETLILAPFKGLRSVILAPFDGIKSVIESTFAGFRNISFSIGVDSASIRRQFQEIGSNAAAGFAEGFSGVQNAAGGAIDSIVRAVRTQLGIQSPSKVFREIGKYAIAGLMQGLDSVDESKLKGVVDKVEGYFKKSKVKINLDIDAKKSPLKEKAKVTLETDSINGDISKAVEKGVRGASSKNIFTVLTGGLLKAAIGIGSGLLGVILLPLKAASLALGTIFAGAGLKLGDELSSGISSGVKSAIGSALSSSIGSSAIVGEAIGEGVIESLGLAFKKLMPGLMQEVAAQARLVLGEEKVFTADAVRRSQSSASANKDRQTATEQVQSDFELVSKQGKPARLKQLGAEIGSVLPDIQQDSKTFAADYAAEQQRLQKIAERFKVKLTPERLIKRRVKEYEEQVKSFEKLAAQLEAKGEIGKADKIRTALAAIPQPDRDPSKISKGELQFQEARYLGEIQAKFVNRELKGQFSGRRAELSQRKKAIAPQMQEYGQLSQELGGIGRASEVLGVSAPVKKPQKDVLPVAYQKIFQQVAALSGVGEIPVGMIPQLASSNKLRPGVYGSYAPENNRVNVPPEVYELIQKGQLNTQIIDTLVHELRHALQFGLGKVNPLVGQTSAVPLGIPTPQEARQFGKFIEGSTSAQPEIAKPAARKLESDAYIFAARNTPQIAAKFQKESAVEQFQKAFGVAGANAEKLLKNLQIESIKKIQPIQGLVQQYGATLEGEIAQVFAQFENLSKSLEPLLNKAASIESLTSEEITQLQQELGSSLSAVIAQIETIPTELKKVAIAKVQSSKKSAPISEAELLSKTSETQTSITANLKQSFKGKPRDRKVINQDLAAATLTEIDNQIALAAEQLKRTDLSGQARQKLGQFKGTLERQYRTYSPALRASQPGSNQQFKTQATQANQQSQGVELLAVSDDIENALAAAKAQLLKFVSQAKNGKQGSSAYGDFYGRQVAQAATRMESEAKVQEAKASLAFAQTKKEVDAAKRLLEQAEAQAKALQQTNARLKQLENVNSANPSFRADLLIGDIDTAEQRRANTVQQIRANPRQFFQQRSKSAVVQKARYITENAEGIANLAGTKIGESPSVEQTKSLLNLQDAFGKVGEASSKFGQNQSNKNFKSLSTAIGELEGALRKLGIPFELINQEIDAYTNKLKKMQAEGKIDIDVDVSSLAPEKFSFIDNILSKFSGLELKGIKAIAGLVKGFLAFGAIAYIQNIFTDISVNAFKAFVELDRLKTALNFASGGSAGGAQNLAFVGKTVEDLKVPLKASTEGFTGLAAAAKGSALEGKETREIFLGISDASTVLSLSADDTKGTILALSQMISKGKVSSEELRQQLGERLPGAMGIAARAMGLTEAEFTRLLDSGQILSQDFLPKFAKQLQSEFGDAAKDASGNAQSAIFGVQNAFLGLQQGIGEGIAPAATAGLNGLSAILKGLASVAKELGFILLGVTATLSIKMVGALQAVIAQLIATRFATGTLGGGMAQLGQTINNSFSVKLTAGIFAVLEVINLLNQAVNTELTQSFEKAAASAKRAAEESAKAFQKPASSQPTTTEPESSSGVGRALDKHLIGFLNMDVGPIKGGIFGNKLKTYGESERDRVTQNTADIAGANTNFLSSAKLRLTQLKTGSGDIGQLPIIDATLRDAEQQRQILQAQSKRNFTDKGLAIPAEDKRRLEAQNLRITDLNNQRSEIAKPFALDLSRTDQQINGLKAQIESLKSPEGIAAVGGDEAALKLTEALKASMDRLKAFKAEAETTLASLRVDPVLAFSNALRQLNLRLSEGQEKNKENLSKNKLANSNEAIAGFSSNKLASKKLTFLNANDEYNSALADEKNYATQDKAYNEAVNRPEFQSTLNRLGVAPDSSIAKIDDVLKNTTDEADKGILEKFKSGRESKVKFGEAKQTTADAKGKLQQTIQDTSLYLLDDSAASSRSAIQKAENDKISFLKGAQARRLISEEIVNEKISRIQLNSTQLQKKSIVDQLTALHTYHEQGKIGAEEFTKRQRDLSVELTATERQEAENRLAIEQAVLARRLKDIEFVNKKAEALITTKQTDGTRTAKEKLLNSGLTPQAQDQFSLDQTKIDATTASDRVSQVKTKIAQNKQLYKEGLKDAREFMMEQYALNQELAQANLAVIEQKIAGEEKYREVVKRNIAVRQTIAGTEIKNRTLALGLTPEAQDKATLEQNKIDQKAVTDQIAFLKSRVKGEGSADQEIAALNSQLADLKIAAEEKYRESVEHSIQRIMQAEDNRYKSLTSQLDFQKASLDLYNQSLERTGKLEESRYNLAKALKEAAIAPLESRLNSTNRGLDLVGKLKDTKDPSVKAAIKAQLEQMGIKQYGLTVTPATVTKSSNGNNPDELALRIIEQKAQLEDEIAAKKEEALKLEQEYQRKSLELDLQRQKIAAETAVYDAESAQLAAAKSKLEAEGALRIAQSKKDPVAIASAKVGLEIADREIKLSDKRLNNALANLSIQDELTTSAKTAQSVGQDAAIKSTESANNLSRQGSALELVEAGAKAGNPMSLASAESRTRAQVNPELALPRKIEINQMPKLDLKPGESIFDAYQRQRDSIPPLDKTAQMVDATKINPQSGSNQNQFAEALKLANQDVVQRLDKLIDSMATVANTPRSLTVQTPNPVDDAAKLMNDLSRGQVVGAGL